jgi:tol-pal system protein YbgF
VQRHLVLVAEPPCGHGAERQFLIRQILLIDAPAPSGAGFVFESGVAFVPMCMALARIAITLIWAQNVVRCFGSVTLLAHSGIPWWRAPRVAYLVRQAKMSVRLFSTAPMNLARLIAVAMTTAIAFPASAQQYDIDADPTMRIERLERQLRQLTGQNEELQHRNRLLEQQLRQLQGGAPTGQAATSASPAQPVPVPANQGYGQPPQQQAANPPSTYGNPPPTYGNQPPAPIEQPAAAPTRGRGDAFDPTRNPNAPGVPRALGGGQLPVSNEPSIGAVGGRGPGEPLNLSNVAAPAQSGGDGQTGLTTLPPSQSPRDEFDLGIGYMQRKDYALAEETMRNFTRRYPNDPHIADAQYWLGESLFQRQKYRDAAESFLTVTSKYDTSAKAPDALLRLGQSLAALKEKEAACAALGEVSRKYPRASSSVKQAVDREQKRTKC